MPTKNGIRLHAPGMESIFVPKKLTSQSLNIKEETIEIWKDKVKAVNQGNKIEQWLTRYFNLTKKDNEKPETSIRLFCRDISYQRKVAIDLLKFGMWFFLAFFCFFCFCFLFVALCFLFFCFFFCKNAKRYTKDKTCKIIT